MEVIADLDFEPKTEKDNSFRNSRNGIYYCKYLGEEDMNELMRIYHGLIFGRVDEQEAYNYLKDKYGVSYENKSLMFSYICGILSDVIGSENNIPYQLEQLEDVVI